MNKESKGVNEKGQWEGDTLKKWSRKNSRQEIMISQKNVTKCMVGGLVHLKGLAHILI